MNINHQMLFKPITKWTTRLKAGKVKETLYKAMQIATSEVPGPVHIGLPGGIGVHESAEEKVKPMAADKIPAPKAAALNKMEKLFAKAKKPVVALGITSIRSGVRDTVLQILEKFQIPAVMTPMAKGMVPEDHQCYAGVLAHALGNQVGQTHQQADLVVGIGYDPVEINYEDWMPNVPLVHLDTTPADLDQEKYTLGCDVVGDLKKSTERLLAADCGKKEWDMDALAQRRKKMFDQLKAPKGSFGPRRVLDGLRKALPKNGIMTCDVGAHLHLIGQHWKTYSPECQLMTNGCSSMGFAIPTAIAAKLSCPKRQVCCVVGDGGFFMMVGEMATAIRLGVKVVFVLITDASLSLIRIKQEVKGHPRYGTPLHAEVDKYQSASTYFGVPVFTAKTEEEYDQALKDAFAADGPAIVEAFIKTEEYDELVLKGNK